MKELRDTIKKARKIIKKMAADLPDNDAYATPYSLLSDLATHIDRYMKELGPALTEAKKLEKKYESAPNRAKRWCAKP